MECKISGNHKFFSNKELIFIPELFLYGVGFKKRKLRRKRALLK